MVGPALGGKLAKASDLGMRLPFFISTGLFLVNAIGVSLLLPAGKIMSVAVATTSKKEPGEQVPSVNKSWMKELASLRPQVQGLLLLRFFIGISIMLLRSGLFMLMEYAHDMDVSDKGYIMSVFAIAGLITQLLIVPTVVRRLSNRRVVFLSSAALVLIFIAISSVQQVEHFYWCVVSFSCASAILKVAMSNALSTAAGKQSKGEVLGVAGSVMSLCRALAPMASGMLVEWYDVSAPIYIACGSMTIVMLLSPMLVPGNRRMLEGGGANVGADERKEIFLKGIVMRNEETTKRLEEKLHALAHSVREEEGVDELEELTVASEEVSHAAAQLNQVLTQRSNTLSVVRALHARKEEETRKGCGVVAGEGEGEGEGEEKENKEDDCQSKGIRRHRRPLTLLDLCWHQLHRYRLPVMIMFLFYFYFRKGRRLH